MAQKASQGEHGGFPGPKAENRLADDWPVYVGFSIALLTLAGIVVVATLATSWHD